MRSIRWAISGFALTLSTSICAAPSVTLVAPAAGTRYIAPTTIQLVADPSVDAGRSIARVEFLADGEIVGVATQAPYTFSWTNVPSGNYALRARVFDNRGARDASPVVRVRVRDNVAPHVRILTPGNKDIFAAPANIAVSLKATDRNDNLTSVTLFANGTQLAVFSAAPYEFNWTNVLPGTYALTAQATDDLGLTTSSRPKTITVTGSQPNVPPTVSLTAPSNDASFTAPASIALSAAAADPDGTIAKVEFFSGPTLIGTSTEAPYSIVWTDVPQGTYALTALATDNAGATASSTAVNIMVARAEPKLYFIEVDHLNTPRAIENDQQQLVWKWDQTEPFGDALPDQNPAGLGAFEFALTISLYYRDQETGMHNATFRDCYDPATGRFCQSDPIGLIGGLNTYLYVTDDPLRKADPDGLQGMPYGFPTYSAAYGPIAQGTSCPPKPDPIRNVCGASGSMPVPNQFPGHVNINSACRAHDLCYTVPGIPRTDCDRQFFVDLMALCSTSTSPQMCNAVALGYGYGIAALGGPAYNQTQAQVQRANRYALRLNQWKN